MIRFLDLEGSPPGFYTDEAIVATHAICMQQTRHDADGVPHPLFAVAGGGGMLSPPHLYLSALWVGVWGSSIVALRSLAAFVMSVSLVGLYVFARGLLGGRGAVFVALAASLSPWMFRFSRIAVHDPALMLLGTTWGMYFFMRSANRRDSVSAAVCFSIAMYSYPPGRALIPLVLLLLCALKAERGGLDGRFVALFVLSSPVLCLPLVWLTVSGGLSRRYELVGLVFPRFRSRLPHQSWWDLVPVFLANLRAHLGFEYLFASGDANLRHSTQGSWPFVALLVGCIMAKWERAWAPSLAACSIVALSFALLFWCDYFTRYPKRAGPWFAANVKEAAVNAESSGDWQGFVRNLYRYDSRAVRYYLIRYGRQGCDASARFYRESAPSRR